MKPDAPPVAVVAGTLAYAALIGFLIGRLAVHLYEHRRQP